MSSLPIVSSVGLPTNRNFDEHRWVISIRRSLEDEREDDRDIPDVCIFKVPKIIMSSKPEAYIPHQVSFGPYHYLRSELYDMERYKLVAAKKFQTQIQKLRFQNLVELLMKLEPRIRGHYDKYLNFNGETLAWMMVVDASFLLEFLHIYAVKEGKILPKARSKLSQIVDYAGGKATHNTILSDVLLLENQIPIFVLKMILESQYLSMEIAEDILNSMLIGLCKEVSPFNLKKESCSIEVMECPHLLDFVYNMIVPKSEQPQPHEIKEEEDEKEGAVDNKGESFGEPSNVKYFFNRLWTDISKLKKGPISQISRVTDAKPVKLLTKLPWNIISRVPGLALLKSPLKRFFFQDKVETNPEEGSSLVNQNKPPLIEEITIPSVTELSKSDVNFVATQYDISSISFDPKTFILHLPTIRLDIHTEVVLRNLVAYETSKGSGPMIITRYTELMNGIIDTEEDVRLLREKGIVLNHLKSDQEVANLWNEMTRSVKLTKVRFLDKIVNDVNKYYSNRWKVKLRKLMKVYVYGSWKILTFLAAIFVLFHEIQQSFCSVYTCFHNDTSQLSGV